MAITDIFKRKKRQTAAKPEKPAVSTPATPAEAHAPKRERRIFGVIIAPHLTEKSSTATAEGWYTFRVAQGAGKHSVKQAVEDRYGVRVVRVRMVPGRSRTIRLGRHEGRVPGFRKALVKVREGERLEEFGA